MIPAWQCDSDAAGITGLQAQKDALRPRGREAVVQQLRRILQFGLVAGEGLRGKKASGTTTLANCKELRK